MSVRWSTKCKQKTRYRSPMIVVAMNVLRNLWKALYTCFYHDFAYMNLRYVESRNILQIDITNVMPISSVNRSIAMRLHGRMIDWPISATISTLSLPHVTRNNLFQFPTRQYRYPHTERIRDVPTKPLTREKEKSIRAVGGREGRWNYDNNENVIFRKLNVRHARRRVKIY